MQGRLTLHVRRLAHISQVSGVFFKESMLEQLHGYTHEIINALSALKNVFGGVGDIFHCVGFNNNQFIDRLNPLPESSGFSFLTYRIKSSYSLLSARTGSFLAA